MDEADRADQEMERATANALYAIRKKVAAPVYSEQCLFCQAFTDDGRRWCDTECRDGWVKENRS